MMTIVTVTLGGEDRANPSKQVLTIQSDVVTLREQPDATQYAAVCFLARYRGDTLRAYGQDLRYFLRWCAERGVAPVQAQRPHLELYLRWMEQQGLVRPLSVDASPPSLASTATPSSTGTATRTRPWP